MILSVIALLIGLLLLGAGVCYLIKEKEDREAKKVYMATIAAGAVLLAAAAAGIMLPGL